MARQEQDREDLLAEASALVERVSIRCSGGAAVFGAESVIGFRPDGSASFYLSPQRVYQFNAAGKLRRAFGDDLLYKAERGQLVALSRQRTTEQVLLVRKELNQAAADEFLARLRADLVLLADSLDAGDFMQLGQVPPDADVIARVRRWLTAQAGAFEIARAARL